MSVLTLAGKAINWDKPPKATDRVMWSQRTSGGKKVTGSLRTIAHLDHMNTLAKKRYGRGIVVIQGPFNTGVRASAGTHDYDACLDVVIPGVPWSEQQSFYRANGAGAYWRRPPAFGHHIHYFTLPPREGKSITDDYRVHGFKVGKYVDGGWSRYGRVVGSAQIGDYYNRRTALSGHARDTSWFPQDIEATIFDLPAHIARQRGDVKPKPPAKPSPSSPVLVWKGKTMPVDGPILSKPPRQHHWSPTVGDRLSAWRGVKPGEALDGNLVPGAGCIWFMHGFTAAQSGYNNVVATSGPHKGRVVPMTKAERTRSLDAWGYAGIKRWRDKHGQAPMTLTEGLRWLVAHHVYGALEVKGPAWGTNPRWFQILHDECKRTGHPAAVKRLVSLRFPRQTVVNAHKAGVKIAAIYGSGVKGRTRRVAATARAVKGWKGVRFDATW